MRASLALLGAIVATVMALPDYGMPAERAVNLVATDAVRQQLRSTFLAATHHRPSRVKGPLRRTVFYARYRGTRWALASFSVPFFKTQGQPTIFRRASGRRWRMVSDTGGSICPPLVPLAVVRVWSLRYEGSGCFAAHAP